MTREKETVTPFATSASPPDEAPRVDLLLFAAARVAAGRSRDEVAGHRLSEVLTAACQRYGVQFAEVLEISKVWVNGEPAAPDHVLSDGDEVAVLPPVSGGAGWP